LFLGRPAAGTKANVVRNPAVSFLCSYLENGTAAQFDNDKYSTFEDDSRHSNTINTLKVLTYIEIEKDKNNMKKHDKTP